MGMSIDHHDTLLGTRSWRYSMLVENGTIKKMFIEPEKEGDPFEVSDAETMLGYLQPDRKSLGPVLVLARHGCPFCARAEALLRNEASLSMRCIWAMSSRCADQGRFRSGYGPTGIHRRKAHRRVRPACRVSEGSVVGLRIAVATGSAALETRLCSKCHLVAPI